MKGRYRKQRNYGCRIHDSFTHSGMKALVLENELIRISLLLDKGAEVFEFLYKPRDLDFVWLTENGIQNPTDYLPTSPDPISSFIDYYPGGWQEVFPNGGPTSKSLGAEFGQHGEVAHMPWDYEIVEDQPEKITVRLTVMPRKIPVRLTRTLTLVSNNSSLYVEQELENLSDVSLPYMWGQHLAYGKPFLGEGAAIILPEGISVITDAADSAPDQAARVNRGKTYNWPLVDDLQGGKLDLSIVPPVETPSEIVYLTGFQNVGWYRLENLQLNMGIKVEWDADRMPYLWYWQEFGATKSYPWYGRHYNIGLEPFSSYPTQGLHKAVENGSAGMLDGYATQTFFMNVRLYPIGSVNDQT